MIKKLEIKNYKSIVDLSLELGKTNVFIGENGCGKSNILEAVAMLSGACTDRLTAQDLSNKGVRIAKPSLTKSSFVENGLSIEDNISFKVDFDMDYKLPQFPNSSDKKIDSFINLELVIESEGTDTIYDSWKLVKLNSNQKPTITSPPNDEIEGLDKVGFLFPTVFKRHLNNILRNFLIYDLNTPALRGQAPLSLTVPVGLHGEGLDLALASLGEKEMKTLLKYKYLISWLEEIVLDGDDQLKMDNLRIKGNSQLYFSDKFMKKNTLFNSENANEGVLHILFYLILFLHPKAPNIFAIDNIETALNPRVCRELMKVICELNQDKQVLITTHNPAVLDGLNLMDDDVRLFAVRRNKKGHTVADRIQFKKGTTKKHKLSEMWMNGLLGAVPINF